MQYVSAAYKAQMKKLARNKSLMRISIGLINQAAQQNAAIQSGSFTYFSNIAKPLNNEEVGKLYATYEENFSKVDGSMLFLPRESSGESYINAGAVTEALCKDSEQPEIRINFNTTDPVDLKGITIDFGEYYPTSLSVITDEKTVQFSNNSGEFRTEETFDNCTYMKIVAKEMINGHGRLRINLITFGIGIVMDDAKIVSSTLKSTISPIAEALPAIDFSVTIENLDKYYNVDNDDSAINYMETGQAIEVYYGLTLDDESIEWVKGGTLCMKEWTADDTEAKFGAVDAFEYMQDDYKGGTYSEAGKTLYELAIEVLTDAGKSSDEYWIDPYLKNIIVHNPLPAVQHKECLQLIANAGRSVVMQSTDGLIMIKSSFVPDVAISANSETEYSDVQKLLEEADYKEYASYERNFAKTDATQYFMPKNKNYVKTGYVSAAQADANGTFQENPIITISMESAYTFYNLTFLFGSILPKEFILRTYNNGVKLNAYKSKNISQKTVVSYDFVDVDQIQIEFTKADPYNRIHMRRVIFGEATDYEITYDDLTKTPSGTRLEKIKQLNIIRTIYTKGTEQKDLTSEEVTIPAEVCEYELDFANPVHDLTVITTIDDAEVDYGAQIVDSTSYWCKIRITKPPGTATDATIQVKGYEYRLSTSTVGVKLNNTGSIETIDNPLISSEQDAANLAEWIGEYYASSNQYELDYRGDPALNCNDLIKLESIYRDDLMVRLEEIDLKYSGSISGSLKARREM